MKRRILHILSSDDFGGAENVAMCIINNLSDSSEFAYTSPQGDIEEILTNRNIKYIPMNKLSIIEIRNVIKKWSPDIIHAHDFTATLKCLLTCSKIPVISHIHQNPNWLRSINKFSIIFFLACIKIKKIIVVTPAIIEGTFLSIIFNKKSVVIKNIVDVKMIAEKASIPSDKSYDISFIGRLEDVKDPLRFIHLISKIVREFPKIKVIMMGGGRLESKCRELIKEKELVETIEMVGFINNPYPIFKNCKLLVMTSKSEGLPMVAIEAMSLGKPVIVPQLKGIESIVDSSCGAICKDDSEFLVALTTLLKSDERYKEMSSNALNKANKLFNMELYKKQFNQVYCSVK